MILQSRTRKAARRLDSIYTGYIVWKKNKVARKWYPLVLHAEYCSHRKNKVFAISRRVAASAKKTRLWQVMIVYYSAIGYHLVLIIFRNILRPVRINSSCISAKIYDNQYKMMVDPCLLKSVESNFSIIDIHYARFILACWYLRSFSTTKAAHCRLWPTSVNFRAP